MKKTTPAYFLSFLPVIIMLSCTSASEKQAITADRHATPETVYLLGNLKSLSERGFLIGHEDATAYGVGWKYGAEGMESDIKSVTGDFPALYGWDLGHIETGSDQNLDSVSFALMKQLIKEAHGRGGVITVSWHLNNPVTGESSWSHSETVKHILPGGTHHQVFLTWLEMVAGFFLSLADDEGRTIPVVFRPWHEWNGSWFWWGDNYCSSAEFIALWKLTVETLRDVHGVHNLLYAFTPNAFSGEEEFLKKYPGDDYVDVLGFDVYVYEGNVERYREVLQDNLLLLKKMAEERKKVYALTETGYEGIPSEDWFTGILYPAVRESGIAWVLFWRNANLKHHYAPYPGHVSAPDFQKFHGYPETLFGAGE